MAWAQSSEVKVTDLNDLSNEKVYFIESQRAFLMYNTEANANGISASTSKTVNSVRSFANSNNWFSIKTIDGNRYLYSIGAGKYITNTGAFSDQPQHALGIKPATTQNGVDNTNYNWMLTIGGNGLNSQDPNQHNSGILVDWWTNNDPGNCYRIIDVESVLPFELCSSYDEITNWYKLGIRDDNLEGPSYLMYDASKEYIPTPNYDENNKEAFAWAFVVTPGAGISIVNKAAGATKVLSAPVAPTGDKNSAQLARMVEKASASGNIAWDIIIPTTHGSTKEFSFYVQHPTANGYAFNRQNYNSEKALCYWTGRDTGSSIWTEDIQGDAVILKALVSELNALFTSKPKGDAVGQYSSSYENYESEFDRISGYASTLADNAIDADIRANIAILNAIKESYSINKPEAGKYYTFSNNDKYITGNVSNDRIACGANNDAYAIYYFDGSRLKSYTNGLYIGLNNTDWTFSENGSAIEFAAAVNGAAGKFNIKSGSGNNGRWLHLTVNTDGTAFVNRCQNNTCGDAHNWVIEEVTNLPVAQSGNSVYYSFADAKAGVKAGETLTLFVDTDETIVLPIGVTLDKNGHSADNVTVATPVAKIGETAYGSLAEAVKAATAGATITFVADINESDTLSKNLTIDGAGFNYTGVMTAAKSKTITVKNVNFVKGRVFKEKEASKGTYTFQNCTFDGEGTSYGYALEIKGAATLKVENCTAKNYVYSFLYFSHAVTNVNINNVVAENVPNYGVYFASGVTTAKFENFTVKHSNNGILVNNEAAKSLTLKDCAMVNVTTAINHAKGTKSITCTLDGVNDFGGAALSEYVKFAKAAKVGTKFYPTLAAAVEVAAQGETIVLMSNTDETVTIPDGVEFDFNNFIAENVTLPRQPAGHVAYRADVTDKEDREGIAILLKEVYAKNSVVVKVYNGETLMFTCTRRDIDDEGKVMFPVDGNTTANIVLWGKESGSWINEIHVVPTELNVPDKIEVYADGVLTESYTHESGAVLGTNLEKYLALDCVKKFAAKIGNVGYETLAAAVAAAETDQTVTLLRDAAASEIITINKPITLDGNNCKLTSTASRAINIETEGEVVINNLTVNAGERAFNIINKPATVVLNGVTAVANNNAVMIATSAGAAKVTIDGCDFTGLAVVNVAGAKSNVAIKNSTITNVDANPEENYGAITVWSSAEEAVVDVENTTITVADDSKKAYIFSANATVTGVDEIGRIVATVGDAGYDTLEEAIEKANAGETIEFVRDVTASEIITINKAITINGNGNTLTSTAGRAINVSGANGVTIKNLTINASGERAINVIQGATNVTIENVTATAANYTVNLAGSAANAVVAIKNSDLTGLNVVNVGAAGAQVAVDGGKITCNDQNSNEGYGALFLNKDAKGAKITATGVTFDIKGDSQILRNGAEGGVITVDDVEYTDNIVAIIEYNNGYYYSFETLAKAVEKAKDGETIKLQKDATGAGAVINKSITIDFNGKTYTVNEGVGSKGTETLGLQILKENNVTLKNGTLTSEGENIKMLINNYANLTVENMKLVDATDYIQYVLSNNCGEVAIIGSEITADGAIALDACKYASYEAPIVTVKEGSTINGNVEVSATLNMNGTLNGAIVINGVNGVVNGAEGLNVTANVADYKPAYADGKYTVVEKNYVAQAGEAKFETLAEAVAEGSEVTLLKDVTGAGVVINKDVTIDFGGFTYTVNEGVGSKGTETLGLQILKGNNVTLKNGTLKSEGENIKMLINNYANLTVDNMKLVDATDYIQYVLSNNSGEVAINNSVITSDAIALDACKYASYEAPVVTVAEGSTINGNVEVSATLNMNGTLNGTIIINAATGTVIGAEGLTVKTNVADHKVVRGEDGAYTVVAKNYVAQVGEAKYETFAAAVAAAPAGGTVTLVADAVEAKTVVLTKNLTIDGAGKTFTGAIEFKKSNGTFTIKNVIFNGAGTWVYALKSQSSTTSLTVEECTATAYTYGFLYANSAIANVTVSDVTVKDVNYGVHSARGTNVTLNNFVAENVAYGVMVQNYSGRNVVLNNCSFTGSENPLYVWKRDGYENKITFNFKGVNEMGKADFCTSGYAIVNADAIVGTKVYATLAAAVEAAEADETVALLRDVQPESYVTIDKSITLNLGEYDITREGTALYVNGDVEVAINGTGTVTGKQALWVANGLAKVNGGNFCGLAEAVYVTNTGKAEIHGGTFASSEYDSFVLNKKDADREATDITVYGGTFVGFNPADNAAEGAGTNFVAEGYVVVDNGDGTYTVKENPAYGKVAKVGEEYYATLTEALAAAAAGTTVELIADVNEDVTLTKNVTINGANFKYTGTMSANANITVNVLDLNFVNAGFSKGTKSSNGNYTFNGCTFDGQGTYSRAIYVRGANKVVLENCTATGYDYFMYVPNALNNSITVKGVTVENCSGYAVMFNSGAGKATFENFTVKNSSTAIIYNNTANRALTLNNCTMENVGTAIRHTGDGVKNITCTFVGKNNLGGADFSEYVVLNNAALAGTTIYASLAEAVAAEGNEVKLLGNSTGAGVVIDKSITIDFNGKTYSFNGGAVGSSNTKSNGFQILKGNNVTLKNGTLNVAEAAKGEFYILIQNYANLTVENMTLDGTNLDKYSTTDGDSYVLSNNSGNVVVNGNTNITANDEGDKAFAFDACDKSGWGYEIPNVTVNTIGKVTGKVEVTGGNLVIYSGTYSMDVNEWCAEGYAATKVADNLWTVIKAIAQVGEVKYASIQDAIDAALDGETVTLLANVTLTDNDVVMTKDGNKTMLYVAGKEITFDMNEKTILVENYSLGNYLLGVFCIEDGAGLTVTGNGAIDVPQLDRQVAYMFWKRGTAGYLVIENGNFHAGNLEDSMIYTNGDEVVTVNGGTFILDRTGERPNGCPWMFNTKGQNVNSIVVNGGTYNTNVSKQHYAHEAKLAEDKTMLDNGDGTWTVIEALAAIDGVGYRTLADAVEAAVEGDYVTLLKDVTDAGIVINKSITIDFNEKTYTVNKAVGSKGTETLGFQILKDNYVTLTNGTLTSTVAVEGSNEIKMLVQNYANLTLEDMNLVDETEHILYALSNNSGVTYLTRNTNITTDAVAFDSYKSKYYSAPIVNVETTGTIKGAIEKNDGATIAISSGTFTVEIYEEWCAEYHVPVQNTNGTWTVESRYIDELTIVDDDYTKFENKHEMTVGTLTYKRTIPNAGVWQSMYVPFEIPVSMLKELGYDVAYFLDVHFEIADGVIDMSKSPDVHVIKINDGILKANFPYAIRANATANLNLKLELEDVVLSTSNEEDMNVVESSSTVNRFVFGGTYTRAIPSELTGDNNAICYAVSKKGEFKMMGENAGLPPFRVYMTIIAKDGAPVKYEGNPAESIAIRVIGEENEDGTTTIYDVNAEEAEEMIFDLSGRRVLETEKGIYIKNGKKVYVK